jgi:hypothetical protein
MTDRWRSAFSKDRRGEYSAAAAVALLAQNPRGLEAVVDGMANGDERVRRRCVIAIERLSAGHPGLLEPHAARIIELAREYACVDLRRQFVPILLRLQGSGVQRLAIIRLLFDFANEGYGTLRVAAVEALFTYSRHNPVERCHIIGLIMRLHDRFGRSDRVRLERILNEAHADAQESLDRSTRGTAILFSRRV